MNLYFLVEGQTEAKIYSKWLQYLLPDFERVKSHNRVSHKNYYLFNAGGFPSIIYKHLPNAIREVNTAGKFDYLVMCFDADENSVTEREDEVVRCLEKKNLFLENTQLILVIQNRCIETWLLGNRAVSNGVRRKKDLKKYTKFYNVALRDPEKMAKPKGFAKPLQQFHFEYFMKLSQHQAIRYRKGHPRGVAEESYLRELEARIDETNHLPSFRNFRNFCRQVSEAVR
ncbi:DUF4276 family protein [Anaerolineales bacterium HSG6]|nr:DUF4276 family protein [Anaerolineales bacterium HSG6]